MTQHTPTGDAVSSVVQVLAAMGGGGVILKLIEHLFRSREKGADDASAFRRELHEEIKVLQGRTDDLERRLDEQRERNALLFAEKEVLRAENHQLRGFLASLVLHAQILHRRLGLPDSELPRVPDWLIGTIKNIEGETPPS